jgi:hypothetical protein
MTANETANAANVFKASRGFRIHSADSTCQIAFEAISYRPSCSVETLQQAHSAYRFPRRLRTANTDMPLHVSHGNSSIPQPITDRPSSAPVGKEELAADMTTKGKGKTVGTSVLGKKRKRSEPVRVQPLRTHPKRGQPQPPSTDDIISHQGAGTDRGGEVLTCEHSVPPSKRVRLVNSSERAVSLDESSMNTDAALSASVDSIGMESQSSKLTREHKANINASAVDKTKRPIGRTQKITKAPPDPAVFSTRPLLAVPPVDASQHSPEAKNQYNAPKRRPARLEMAGLAARRTGARQSKHAPSDVGDKIPHGSGGPVDHDRNQQRPSTTDSVKVKSGHASASAAPVVWRGGLNGRLAEIMAHEYNRILNPAPGIGKMVVYREWAATLGIGAFDTDGSRLRKAVARLKKEFDKAYVVMASGDYEEETLLRICPEFCILLPVLRPSEKACGPNEPTSREAEDNGSLGVIRLGKRKHNEDIEDMGIGGLVDLANKRTIERLDGYAAASPGKRFRPTTVPARTVSLGRQSSQAASNLTKAAPPTAPSALPRIRIRFTGQIEHQATLLAEHASAVGDASIIRDADLLISIMADCFRAPSSLSEQPKKSGVSPKAIQKGKGKVGRGKKGVRRGPKQRN